MHVIYARARRQIEQQRCADTSGGSVLFLEQFADLSQEVFGEIRFAEETAIVRDFSSCGLCLARANACELGAQVPIR
jgi:hypothetical protein